MATLMKSYEVQCVRAARRGVRGRWRIIENSTRQDIVVSSHDVRAAAIRERDRLRAAARGIQVGDTVSVLARNPLGKPSLARVLEVMDDSARHGEMHGMRYRLDDGTIRSAYWVKAL